MRGYCDFAGGNMNSKQLNMSILCENQRKINIYVRYNNDGNIFCNMYDDFFDHFFMRITINSYPVFADLFSPFDIKV